MEHEVPSLGIRLDFRIFMFKTFFCCFFSTGFGKNWSDQANAGHPAGLPDHELCRRLCLRKLRCGDVVSDLSVESNAETAGTVLRHKIDWPNLRGSKLGSSIAGHQAEPPMKIIQHPATGLTRPFMATANTALPAASKPACGPMR